ncbi:MAG TPA: hypothetical protein VNZ43_13160 [Sphingomonadaceae bacterium]|nr:hypothetical protein [Sphingomonadaceae bacterium]
MRGFSETCAFGKVACRRCLVIFGKFLVIQERGSGRLHRSGGLLLPPAICSIHFVFAKAAEV